MHCACGATPRSGDRPADALSSASVRRFGGLGAVGTADDEREAVIDACVD
jgi:hypothetical protein